MEKTILSVLHNIKDYQYYDNSAMPLQKDDADIIIAFLEQDDVQRCIPKAVKTSKSYYGEDIYSCPNCKINLINKKANKCGTCGQKIRWVENEIEKDNSIGSSIFDNFGVSINNK